MNSNIWFNILLYFLKIFLKIGTWANICCQSSFFRLLLLPKVPQYIVVYSSCECLWLCYVGRHLSVAWRAVPRIRTSETLGRWSWARELNSATEPAPQLSFLNLWGKAKHPLYIKGIISTLLPLDRNSFSHPISLWIFSLWEFDSPTSNPIGQGTEQSVTTMINRYWILEFC